MFELYGDLDIDLFLKSLDDLLKWYEIFCMNFFKGKD